ncbi:hypothetical protein GCM10010282_19010 [Streptomyces roseolus]|nr:hypothetical protein GCM10010282_19010 [Streptomyces roseolus]
MFGEDRAHVRTAPGRDHRLDIRLADALDLLRGHHDVEAVRPPVGVLLHPVEVAGQVVRGGVADRAQHPETAGPAEGGGDRGEGREAEDGVLDPQCATQLRLHGRQDAAAGRRREEVF